MVARMMLVLVIFVMLQQRPAECRFFPDTCILHNTAGAFDNRRRAPSKVLYTCVQYWYALQAHEHGCEFVQCLSVRATLTNLLLLLNLVDLEL